MKKMILGALLILLTSIGYAQSYNRVSGYYRSNGTYVEPYYRTSPNNTIRDNWSTYPNVNPFTGRMGTVNPYNYNPYRRRGIY